MIDETRSALVQIALNDNNNKIASINDKAKQLLALQTELENEVKALRDGMADNGVSLDVALTDARDLVFTDYAKDTQTAKPIVYSYSTKTKKAKIAHKDIAQIKICYEAWQLCNCV